MIKKIIFVLALVFVVSIPNTASAQFNNEEEYRAYLFQVIELLQQQIILLQAENETPVVRGRLSEPDNDEFKSFLIDDEDDIEAWYEVSRPEAVGKISNKTHRLYFSRFFEIVPDEYDDYFVDLLIYDDSGNDFDGFVETVAPFQKDTWRIGISESMFEFSLKSQIIEELYVHEFAHIISYETVPGKLSRSNASCHEFFDNFGCPPSNSFLIDFIDEFWSDEDMDAVLENDDPDWLWTSRELREDFVTEYAGTNPAEDFAESFAFFVLENRAIGNELKDEKINYFYNFSNMVDLREEIRLNI